MCCKKPVIIISSLLLVFTVRLCTAQGTSTNTRVYPNPSDNGRSLSRSPDGQMVLSSGREETEINKITSLRLSGNLQEALNMCNQILATNVAHRWAMNARMQIYGEIGEISRARQDFLFLTERYPGFLEAYNSWAAILLLEPLSENGTSPFLDWLNSSEPRKKAAAQNVISRAFLDLRDRESRSFNSSDPDKQRAALRLLQTILKLESDNKGKIEN